MTIPILGRLETVPARLAWPDEARSFTPWLAANLDRLGEAVGLELEIQATEVAVGRYRADIVARETRDGSVVLIENQLEPSDNEHLGQVLTYLTGLDAKRIIWIAPRFSDEHLSAVHWLNQHTADPFTFFAVAVSVVRIGDSAMAPLFEVLEKPNDWDRNVTVQTERSAKGVAAAELRREFWHHLVLRHPTMLQDGAVGGSSYRWRVVPGTALVVSQYLSSDGVGVFVRGGRGIDNSTAIARLRERQETLAERIGAPFGRIDFPFSHRFSCDTNARENWDAMADWLETEATRVAAIVSDVMADQSSGAQI